MAVPLPLGRVGAPGPNGPLSGEHDPVGFCWGDASSHCGQAAAMLMGSPRGREKRPDASLG
jgi:hypothetical protein